MNWQRRVGNSRFNKKRSSERVTQTSVLNHIRPRAIGQLSVNEVTGILRKMDPTGNPANEIIKPIIAPGQDYLSPEEIESTRLADARRLEIQRIFHELGETVPAVQYANHSHAELKSAS